MPLPANHSVSRTCKASHVDRESGKPQPPAFELRFSKSHEHESYVSVNWLELLSAEGAAYEQMLSELRRWLLDQPDGEVIKPTAKGALAVLPVEAIQGIPIDGEHGSLECDHAPHKLGDTGDPHSSVRPDPGVETWPKKEDAPARLAVQQFLYSAMCYWERGKLPNTPAE